MITLVDITITIVVLVSLDTLPLGGSTGDTHVSSLTVLTQLSTSGARRMVVCEAGGARCRALVVVNMWLQLVPGHWAAVPVVTRQHQIHIGHAKHQSLISNVIKVPGEE